MKDVKIKLEGLEGDDKKTYAIFRFRSYRKKIQDYILHYDPGTTKSEIYETLKHLIETYWDCSDKLWKEFEKI